MSGLNPPSNPKLHVLISSPLKYIRRFNQSILKEISPVISLEGMMLKLKLQYFGHLMRRVDSLEKTLMLGGIGGRRRRGGQRMRWLMASLTRWMWVWVNSGSWWWTVRPVCCDSWGCKESDTTEWLNWNESKQGLPYGSAGKESACNAGDLGLIPGLERSTGEESGYPLQYSGLENSMDCPWMELQRVGHNLVTFTFNQNKHKH